jgi:uncharacterized protein (DUF2147 family)
MRVFCVSVLMLLPSFALADPVVGIWKTEPDKKNLISHIAVSTCGAKICGKVLKAFDRSGKEVATPNVGKPLFWDMQPTGGGKYSDGTVYVATLNMKARGSMELNGNALRVTGCKGPACYGQTWTRLN